MPDELTLERLACDVARQLFGHRWDDLESQDDVAARFTPIADAMRRYAAQECEKARREERERFAAVGKALGEAALRIKELELENDHWKNCYQELEEYNNKKIEELEVEITQLNRKV